MTPIRALEGDLHFGSPRVPPPTLLPFAEARRLFGPFDLLASRLATR
jgi:hypothetical protein